SGPFEDPSGLPLIQLLPQIVDRLLLVGDLLLLRLLDARIGVKRLAADCVGRTKIGFDFCPVCFLTFSNLIQVFVVLSPCPCPTPWGRPARRPTPYRSLLRPPPLPAVPAAPY